LFLQRGEKEEKGEEGEKGGERTLLHSLESNSKNQLLENEKREGEGRGGGGGGKKKKEVRRPESISPVEVTQKPSNKKEGKKKKRGGKEKRFSTAHHPYRLQIKFSLIDCVRRVKGQREKRGGRNKKKTDKTPGEQPKGKHCRPLDGWVCRRLKKKGGGKKKEKRKKKKKKEGCRRCRKSGFARKNLCHIRQDPGKRGEERGKGRDEERADCRLGDLCSSRCREGVVEKEKGGKKKGEEYAVACFPLPSQENTILADFLKIRPETRRGGRKKEKKKKKGKGEGGRGEKGGKTGKSCVRNLPTRG